MSLVTFPKESWKENLSLVILSDLLIRIILMQVETERVRDYLLEQTQKCRFGGCLKTLLHSNRCLKVENKHLNKIPHECIFEGVDVSSVFKVRLVVSRSLYVLQHRRQHSDTRLKGIRDAVVVTRKHKSQLLAVVIVEFSIERAFGEYP